VTGVWLRGPQHEGHRCQLDDPWAAEVGSVWRCSCGRRWVIREHWDGRRYEQVWRRRRLPWPRRSPAEREAVSSRGQRGQVVMPGVPPPPPDPGGQPEDMDYDG
jgi:hypothetical protein